MAPSRQCLELTEVSLHDTGETGRAKALLLSDMSSLALHTLGPDQTRRRSGVLQAESWQRVQFLGRSPRREV